jgi:hypothetical protein
MTAHPRIAGSLALSDADPATLRRRLNEIGQAKRRTRDRFLSINIQDGYFR